MFILVLFIVAVIRLENYPIRSFYQADGVKLLQLGGRHYIVAASEGDVREFTVEDNALDTDFNEAFRGRSSDLQGQCLCAV